MSASGVHFKNFPLRCPLGAHYGHVEHLRFKPSNKNLTFDIFCEKQELILKVSQLKIVNSLLDEGGEGIFLLVTKLFRLSSFLY